MYSYLQVEFFDTDASSFRHRLAIALKSVDSFRIEEGNRLCVEDAEGRTRFVPLSNVREYYVVSPSLK